MHYSHCSSKAAAKRGDRAYFPFYWAQLADYLKESDEPQESNWALLREVQTKTLNLTKTGQAVIIDLGEAKEIHPRNKYEVASCLVRWALVQDYGYEFPYRNPEFRSLENERSNAIVQLDCFGSRLKTVDAQSVTGFAICGQDRVWHWAKAEIVDGTSVSVSSDVVTAPVAVRYAWANNPVCNLYSSDDLPVTPFRTDDVTFKEPTSRDWSLTALFQIGANTKCNVSNIQIHPTNIGGEAARKTVSCNRTASVRLRSTNVTTTTTIKAPQSFCPQRDDTSGASVRYATLFTPSDSG